MQRRNVLEDGYQVLQRARIANKVSAQMVAEHPECIELLQFMETAGMLSGTRDDNKLNFSNLIHCIKSLKKAGASASFVEFFEKIRPFLTPVMYHEILKLMDGGAIFQTLNEIIQLNKPLTAEWVTEMIHHPSGYIGMQRHCNRLFPVPEEAQQEFLYVIKKIQSGEELEGLRGCLAMDAMIGPQTWFNSKNFRTLVDNANKGFYITLGFRLLSEANLLETYRDQLIQYPKCTLSLSILWDLKLLNLETVRLALNNPDFIAAKNLCSLTGFLHLYRGGVMDQKGFVMQLLSKPRLCYALSKLNEKVSATENRQQNALLAKMHGDVKALLQAMQVKFEWNKDDKHAKPTISERVSFFNTKPTLFEPCWLEIHNKYQINETPELRLKKTG